MNAQKPNPGLIGKVRPASEVLTDARLRQAPTTVIDASNLLAIVAIKRDGAVTVQQTIPDTDLAVMLRTIADMLAGQAARR